MTSRFLVCIRGGLGFLFPHPYLLGGLIPFGEEQQKEGEHILYPLSHPHPQTRPSFPSLHHHAHPIAGVLNLSVSSRYFHYP